MDKQELIAEATKKYKEKEKELLRSYSDSSKFVGSGVKYKTFADELYVLRMEYEDCLRQITYSEESSN